VEHSPRLLLCLWGQPGVAPPSVLQDSPKAVVDEVWQLVNREYVDPTFNSVNWQVTTESLEQNYTSHEQAYTAVRFRKVETLHSLSKP